PADIQAMDIADKNTIGEIARDRSRDAHVAAAGIDPRPVVARIWYSTSGANRGIQGGGQNHIDLVASGSTDDDASDGL
ncbi:hypothetical protein, partial [Klebsiella pneumoniae]|uniref:hypothetical protein n=1 Tax=Klebsiella pneumoniae TaxID=573 RepID=UPI0021092E0F